MESWFNLTVPSSILAVIEASDAMNDSVDGLDPAGLGMGAPWLRSDALPDHARVGLWVFSTDQGGDGQDWREMAPLRRLDAPIGNGGRAGRPAGRGRRGVAESRPAAAPGCTTRCWPPTGGRA